MAKGKDKAQPILIRKRVKTVQRRGHGGAWKIAYADFVTALMAFFLLMWLITNLTKAQLTGIAQYFQQPLKVALEGGPGAGSRSSTSRPPKSRFSRGGLHMDQGLTCDFQRSRVMATM